MNTRGSSLGGDGPPAQEIELSDHSHVKHSTSNLVNAWTSPSVSSYGIHPVKAGSPSIGVLLTKLYRERTAQNTRPFSTSRSNTTSGGTSEAAASCRLHMDGGGTPTPRTRYRRKSWLYRVLGVPGMPPPQIPACQ